MMVSRQTPISSMCRPARMLALLGVVLAVACALMALPTQARAGDISIPKVTIDATVATDGTITVVEDRTFSFDGSSNGIYWDIPDGTYNDNDVTVSVTQMGLVDNGQFTAYQQVSSAYNGQSGVFTARETTNDSGTQVMEAKIYSPHDDEKATFRICYTITGVTSAWKDTGELYWKYVSDGWSVESQDVTCTIHLPVPEGKAVSGGENVRAWGHGPLDGEVSFTSDGVVLTSPGVGTDEYAEARVTFPVSWLSGMTPSSSSQLSSIISEETEWADEANAKRDQARAVLYGTIGTVGAVAVLGLLNILRVRRRYDRTHKAQFSDPYFRDMPSTDHPCVLGVLWNSEEVPQEDFTAALMSLTDAGALSLDKVERDRRPKEDYRLTLNASRAEKLTDPCDRATVDLLQALMTCNGSENQGVLDFSDMKAVAKKRPETYNDTLTDWQDGVKGIAEARGFFVDDSSTGRAGLLVLSIANIVVAACAFVGLIIMGIFGGGTLVATLAAVAACGGLLVVGLVGCAQVKKLPELSDEAIEIKAKMAALKKWLCEFTLLKEAVPQDVALWDRLLVMAVVLGVADKVIEQLKVAAPQVLEDPGFMPVYGWYYMGYGRLGNPAAAIGQSFEAAHSVSTAALASSTMSSGGGFGGGFSGGGGGGFGGGGGGGSF